MNELVVPPAPHWYKHSVMTCSPDNTLVYGSKNDIVIIKEKTPEEPVEVRTIHGAHSKHIVSVSLNKKWKNPHAYVASLGEDNIIKVWNLDTLEKKTTNKDHTELKEPVIGAVFAGDDRIVSASSHGHIIVWNINTNESQSLKDLFKTKVTLTCLSSCPHAAWLIAFGLSTGCVAVADVRRNGQLLYSLRGHYQSVVSLSWCPAPVNVFPRYVNNKVKNKSENSSSGACAENIEGKKSENLSGDASAENIEGNKAENLSSDASAENIEGNKAENSSSGACAEIIEGNNSKNLSSGICAESIEGTSDKKVDLDKADLKDISEVKVKEKKVNPWINLTHADDEEIDLEKHDDVDVGQDFLKECASLKNVILGLDDVKKNEVTESEKRDVTGPVEKKKGRNKTKKIKKQQVVEGRPLPKLFDPSGDFLDDSGFDDNSTGQDVVEIENQTLEPDSIDLGKAENEDKSTEKTDNVEKLSLNGDNAVGPEIVELENSTLGIDGIDEEKAKNEDGSSEKSEETVTIEKSPSIEEYVPEDKDVGNEKDADGRSDCEDKEEETVEVLEDKDIGNEKEQDQKVEGTTYETTDESSKHEEIIEEEPRTEYLLASSGKDQSVYIWRAGTDGRMQTYFMASKKSHKKMRIDNPNFWISLCWITPDTILTSSTTGVVVAWPVPKPKDSNKQFKVVHSEHLGLVFNIVAPPKYSTAYNWRDNVDSSIWTWGQDGKLINFDLSTGKVRFSYATVSAMVTCLTPSVLDPNRLAIGLKDGGIRVWDLSLPHTNIVTMQKYQQKITHKVSTIALHPQKEMVLGFGTEEGRVGFMDLTSRKSSLFPHYFKSVVYKVEWGPIRGNTTDLGLYVLSEGKIAIYDMQKPDEDPIHLELPDKLYVYKFAWKPNHSLLLLNGKDGSLVVLKSDLAAIATVYPNEKGLNGIVWHPDAFTDKTEVSPRCNWFAATTTKGVIVFDCTSIGENDSFADKVVATFEGHLKPPLALAWCPFEGNKIVSTASDGLSHVWDVTTKSVVATFVDSYLSHNLAIIWSPVEPDLIIMGDKTLRVWSISKNPPKIDDEFMTSRKRLLNKFSKKETDKVDKNKIKVDISIKPKSNPRNYIVPAIYVANDENIAKQVDNMRKLMDSDGTQVDSLKIFGGKEQVAHLLDANYGQQAKEGKYKSCELISLWKGNVGEYIQNAISEDRVTPSVIALAPMVSPKLWQDACLTYAKKLSEDANSDPLETAMYFLVCHKVEEAINCLCLNSMFKEALALAKHRLPENSDIITKVVEQWAEHCEYTGNFENAAYCYISIKDYQNAAKVLARRNHKEFLEFAIELAEKAGNKGLCDSIRFKHDELQNSEGAEINGIVQKDVPSRTDAVLKIIESETTTTEDESQIETGVEEDSILDKTDDVPQKESHNDEEKDEI